MENWKIIVSDKVEPEVQKKLKRVLKPTHDIGRPQECLFCGVETVWVVNGRPVCLVCAVAYEFLSKGWAASPCEVCDRPGEWWTDGDPQHFLCHIHRDAWFHWTKPELGLIDSKVEPEKWHQAWTESWNRFVATMKENMKKGGN